jgi:hypothetical protein
MRSDCAANVQLHTCRHQLPGFWRPKLVRNTHSGNIAAVGDIETKSAIEAARRNLPN